MTYLFVKRRANRSYEPMYIKAQTDLINGKPLEATDEFKNVISSIKPDSPFYTSSLVGLAQAYMQLQEYDKALKYITEAQELVKNKPNEILKSQISKLQIRIQNPQVTA